MSRKTERKQRQKQQKQYLQLAQSSQSSQSSQPQPQEQQPQQREPQTPTSRRSPSFTRTLQTIDESSQTDFRQPLLHQEPPEEDPPSNALKAIIFIILIAFCLGHLFASAVKWWAPRVGGAMRLAFEVFVAEMVHFVKSLAYELMMVCVHIVSGEWGFLEYAIMLVLMGLLVGYLGTRYILRLELAQVNPHGDGYSFEASGEDVFSVRVVSAEEESASASEAVFAMAA